MKKKYSLDYSIERDIDRLHAVEEILDTLDTTPSQTDLEQLASYILYGKDENGQNAVKRGEITDSNRRYNSFARAADKVQSLDEILDNPLADQQNLQPVGERYIYTKKKPAIQRPKYDKEGNLLDIGDGDIPGMQELWDTIDRLDHVVAVNEGKVPPDETTQLFSDPYRFYQFKHALIDIRRHQYYLKDAYKPTLHFLALIQPKAQTYNWDTDAAYWMTRDEWEKKVASSYISSVSKNIEDYETRTNPDTGELEVRWVVRQHHFDWENPEHIKCLINYYSAIYMELGEKLDSWGRTLIYDFDRYFDMCEFSPLREYILTRKIDKASFATIQAEVEEKYGIHYNENHLSLIISKEIPEKMAAMAKKTRLLAEWPEENRKKCFTCKRMLPRDNLFFANNAGRKDGLSSNCKECERQHRINKGEQTKYDARSKDPSLPKM